MDAIIARNVDENVRCECNFIKKKVELCRKLVYNGIPGNNMGLGVYIV